MITQASAARVTRPASRPTASSSTSCAPATAAASAGSASARRPRRVSDIDRKSVCWHWRSICEPKICVLTCDGDGDNVDVAGQYSGKYYEDCPTCPGKCDELAPCVQCKYFQSGPLHEVRDEWGVEECSKCPFDLDHGMEVVEKAEDFIHEDERLCTDLDEDGCRFTFVYGYNNKTGQLEVWVQQTKECPQVVDILGIVLGVIGAIVAAGITLIIMWKIFVEIHDRREFAKFEKERREAQWDAGMNPIYKQATSTFKNPTYNGRM